MLSTIFKTSLAAAFLTLAPLGASASTLIQNGDFEAGFVGFGTEYQNTLLRGGSRGGLQTVQVAPHINQAFSGSSNKGTRGGDHTTGSGLALFVNGDNRTTTAFWTQSVGLAANTDYVFSAWGTLWFGGPSVQGLFMDGVELGRFTIAGARDAWSEYEFRFTTGASPSGELRLQNLSIQFSGNDFAVDDLRLERVSAPPVPLPAAGFLLVAGLGALGALGRRRS